MQNQPDAVMDQTYEPTPSARQDEPVARPSAAVRRDFYDDPRRKSPILALVLSMMPGVGQIYVGYYHQGFTNALVFASLIAVLSADLVHGAEPLFAIFLAFFWFYNVVDAWRRATFYNNALAGIGPATLPDDFAVTSGRGTLPAGPC
jgi:TM2 domain-containing membrane protein YozV